jgi:hypothetical protein
MNLSVELVNGILQYLGSRPYIEVANLITGIQTEAAAQAPAADIDPAEPASQTQE